MPSEAIKPLNSELSTEIDAPEVALSTWPPEPSPPESKAVIRTSLKASTLDGVFATIFSNVAGGVLLSNFLVELHASPVQVGLLASIPMLVNLLQPLGAFFGDRTNSRHNYCLWIYGPARLLWLILVAGIVLAQWNKIPPEALIQWTLAIVFVSHVVGAFGSAAWLSWMATLVPRRLRGRYFGIRSSAASLTNLLSVPILGFIIAAFPGGSIQGYGVMLVFAIVAGIISLGFQFFMIDVNPQVQQERTEAIAPHSPPATSGFQLPAFLQDTNFLLFLLYLSLWTFAVNLSAP
ncbi:MFS transporter, partial [Leptolyngbya sp. FACHB-36]|uniref:MFS transporter n=1 Tax=Leptolyngbya sp. FACHB-36 TaxID=2692808 RepID=UPI003220708A